MLIETVPLRLREAVVALWSDVGLTRPWNDPHADLARALGGPSSTVLVAHADDRLLGTAMVGHDGHRGWVYYVAVHPGEQGRGLGRQLIHACEAWLRERRIPKIQLMVRRANTGVIPFYETLGYQESEVIVLSRSLD